VTVFECAEDTKAKRFNGGTVRLIFTVASEPGSKSCLPYSVIKFEDGKSEFTIRSLWLLTGEKEKIDMMVIFK